jgi:ABC-type proline/glycine betaine transport system substrate-binding protein
MNKSLFLKTFAAFILSSFLVLSAGTANAKRLTAAVADWTGGEITCQVAVSILEQELGYKVERIVFPSGTGLWEAISAGDIDFACESWPGYAEADDVMLNAPLIYDGEVVVEYSGTGEVIAFTTGIIGASDYYVPKYFVDANPDFKNWEDLNKFKAEFATVETGSKGRLIGCPVAGWNCHDQKRLDLLGLDFEAVELGTEVALLAEAQGAYDRKEPFLMYLWEPHFFFGKNEMVGIQLPPHNACETFTEANNWKDCGVGSWPATNWPKDFTMNYMNPAVMEKPENAEALAFFKKMKFQNGDQAKMLVRVDSDGLSVEEAVQEWKDSTDEWQAWLP